MVRVVFGQGMPRSGELVVDALTMAELWSRLREQAPEIDPGKLQAFVNGHDASRYEGELTPIGEEDTVLLAIWPLPE